MVTVPHKSLERKILASGYSHIIGIDEVGMGCLAGPVTACAFAIPKDFYAKQHPALSWLRDSKLLSAKQRETFQSQLQSEPTFVYNIASVEPNIIDTINIYQAARQAMRTALTSIISKIDKPFVLIDGPRPLNDLELPQQAIIKGDRKIFAIACASIMAKVHRDQLMTDYAQTYPGYGFEKHKGYGTTFHRQQIKALGITSLHRKSFKLD